jgi:hypothetical protein
MAEAIITHYTVGERNVSYVMNVVYQGKQWTIQRRYSDFVRFDKKLKLEGYAVGYDLPSKVVFGNFYPSVLDHRRKELNKYLRNLGACLSSDNTYLREFFEVDENILKYALKKNRRLSDIFRSDNIRQIYKRASQLMINANALRHHSRHRKQQFNRSITTSSFSGYPRRTAAPLTPPRVNTTKGKQKGSVTPQSPLRGKRGVINNTSTFSILQENTRQCSCSSTNDTIIDSLQESSIMAALKDDFLTHSRLISSEYDGNNINNPFFYDENNKDAFDDTQRQKSYLSNVNSCFRQKSEDGSWLENSSNSKIINILSPPSLPNMTQILSDMTDIAHLIRQQMEVPFTPDDVIVNPGPRWESDFRSAIAAHVPPTRRPPYHRPHDQESTVPLRLRFNKDDTKANMPPHLIKHIL